MPDAKKLKIIKDYQKWLQCPSSTIQELSELIGYLNSCTPAVACGPLYIRELEITKIKALAKSMGDYSKKVTLSSSAVLDLQWWCKRDSLKAIPIKEDVYDMTVFTDASLSGWGAHFNSNKTLGFWLGKELSLYINVLELKAIENAVKVFANSNNLKIIIRTDSTTAISYINKYGGCRLRLCHEVAKRIWQ